MVSSLVSVAATKDTWFPLFPQESVYYPNLTRFHKPGIGSEIRRHVLPRFVFQVAADDQGHKWLGRYGRVDVMVNQAIGQARVADVHRGIQPVYQDLEQARHIHQIDGRCKDNDVRT